MILASDQPIKIKNSEPKDFNLNHLRFNQSFGIYFKYL